MAAFWKAAGDVSCVLRLVLVSVLLNYFVVHGQQDQQTGGNVEGADPSPPARSAQRNGGRFNLCSETSPLLFQFSCSRSAAR